MNSCKSLTARNPCPAIGKSHVILHSTSLVIHLVGELKLELRTHLTHIMLVLYCVGVCLSFQCFHTALV